MTKKFDKIYEETINEINANDIKHFALDIVGLIPGVGDPADITNGIMYATEAKNEKDGMKKAEKYLYSALSFISAIPEPVSDVVAKGIKVLGGKKLIGPLIQKIGPDKLLKAWSVVMKDFIPKILKYGKEKNFKDFDESTVKDMDESVSTTLQKLST